jgi:hypothetical protein
VRERETDNRERFRSGERKRDPARKSQRDGTQREEKRERERESF